MPRGVYKRSPEHIAKTRAGLEAGRTPEARAKANATLRANAADPAWREKVSQATKKAMHRPDVRERHLAALLPTRNFKHGNGQEPAPLALLIEAILTPLGFKREYPIRTKGHITQHKPPTTYKADFANPTTKTVIELDGPAHNPMERKALDRKKTEVLESLGWQVIRVPHKGVVFS